MASEHPYDPHSHNAMFARILQRMDTQDAVLQEIRDGVKKTNGRVNGLERWRDIVTAKVAGISLTVSVLVSVAAWLLR